MAEFFKKFKELDIFGVKHNTNKSRRWRKPAGAMEDMIWRDNSCIIVKK